MFYRIGTRLRDTPGALATIASRLGDAGESAARRLMDDPTRVQAELTGLLGPRVSLSPTERT